MPFSVNLFLSKYISYSVLQFDQMLIAMPHATPEVTCNLQVFCASPISEQLLGVEACKPHAALVAVVSLGLPNRHFMKRIILSVSSCILSPSATQWDFSQPD